MEMQTGRVLGGNKKEGWTAEIADGKKVKLLPNGRTLMPADVVVVRGTKPRAGRPPLEACAWDLKARGVGL